MSNDQVDRGVNLPVPIRRWMRSLQSPSWPGGSYGLTKANDVSKHDKHRPNGHLLLYVTAICAPTRAAGSIKTKLTILNQRGAGTKTAITNPITISIIPYIAELMVLDRFAERAVTYPPPATATKPRTSDHIYKAVFVEAVPTKKRTTEPARLIQGRQERRKLLP